MPSLILRQLLALVFVLVCKLSNANLENSIGNSVSIENDILHFSYELERTWLDGDKQPCQNFYDFVCGKSLNGSEIQQQVQKQQQVKFERLLTTANDENLLDAELKLKEFYTSCKEARSVEDLKSSFMYRTSGGWPAIDDTAVMIRRRRNMTWLNVLSAFHDARFEYFFKTRVEIKSNKRIVHIEPDENVKYTLRKYEQLASDVLTEYATEAGRARIVALEIMSFERNRREFAKLQVSMELQEFSYADMKIALQYDWDAYFKRTLGKNLKPNDTIFIHQRSKLQKYFELIQNTTKTRFLNWIWIDYLMDKNENSCQSLARTYFGPVYEHVVERATIDTVQMAQMYADIASAYEELLPRTKWIDEMSLQRSKQFHGRIMHLTLNGNEELDSGLNDLTITRRNFYRNLEKMQQKLQQTQQQQQQQQKQFNPQIQSTQTREIIEAANEFMKLFLTVGAMLQQRNLTTPLNYFLVGEAFAEYMIASGSSSTTPGAWRSMDSEREFELFKQCLSQQISSGSEHTRISSSSSLNYNSNDLLLRILAQHQTLHALNAWQAKNVALWKRLDRLLSAGRLQLTLRKLYFVGALLSNCHSMPSNEQRTFIHTYLRNSQEFTQTFGCRAGDELFARKTCQVL